jgi:tripartite-type tricarboxylate transporter receptor subunit TctC
MVAVQYQSTPHALVGLIAGTAQVFFGNVSDVMELVQSGKVAGLPSRPRNGFRCSLMFLPSRRPFPVMTGWIGYFAPAGTRPSIIQSTLEDARRDLPRP